MNQKTQKSDELVTDEAKVTGCDGLPVFNWRRFQLTRQPAITRHYPSPVTNCDLAPSSHKPMTAPGIAKTDEQSTLAVAPSTDTPTAAENSAAELPERTLGKDGKSYPNRLRWKNVKHSNPPRPPDKPTDPARVQLAEECGAILSAFPGGKCKRKANGDWIIHQSRYSHAQALQLVATLTARRNGEQMPAPVVPDFDAGAAYREHELLTGDAVIEIQEPEMVELFPPFSEVKS